MAGLSLANRVVMAPMTRARANGTLPTADTALYYAQRSSAGLIITESMHVSNQARGYLCTPGIHTAEQVQAWRNVTDAVHSRGGRIFAQLWHVGRVSHTSLQENGAAPVGPTAEPAADTRVQAYDLHGKPGQVPASIPVALNPRGIAQIVADFKAAAAQVLTAGFDGIELHAGNGYLFEQFINGALNRRTDRHGGSSIANRLRLLLETVDAMAEVVGHERIGVRITPFARLNDMQPFDSEEETWLGLAEALSGRGIAYLHASHLGSGSFQREVRNAFTGTLMMSGGFTPETARQSLERGEADLAVFGRPFIANPDLVERMKNGWPLAEAGQEAFYGGGSEGYIDYPTYHPAIATNRAA
jgi:2,4-dienoyl-CoA reductase-like NADH-dependent reductase (Old Yellow Enzyme family)